MSVYITTGIGIKIPTVIPWGSVNANNVPFAENVRGHWDLSPDATLSWSDIEDYIAEKFPTLRFDEAVLYTLTVGATVFVERTIAYHVDHELSFTCETDFTLTEEAEAQLNEVADLFRVPDVPPRFCVSASVVDLG